MNRRLKVVVDADALVAQVIESDEHHKKALDIYQILLDKDAVIYYPSTTITEFLTTLQRKFNKPKLARDMSLNFAKLDEGFVTVDASLYNLAVNKYYTIAKSKKKTIFDTIVAASAERLKADVIFSFKSYYKKFGFKLASELK